MMGLRRYNASYTSPRTNKKESAKLAANTTVIKKFVFRMTVFTLAGTIGTISALSLGAGIAENQAEAEKKRILAEKEHEHTPSEDELQYLQNYIEANPTLLKDATEENYTVKMGDSLSSVAEACGNTVQRIAILNGLSSNDMLYYGTEIKVERLEDKSDLDKEITCLEKWFDAYLMGHLYNNLDQNSRLKVVFDLSLYGTTSSHTVTNDGKFVQYNALKEIFYNGNGGPKPVRTDEEKEEYISQLRQIANSIVNELNMVDGIIPPDTYATCLKNRTATGEKQIESIYRRN